MNSLDTSTPPLIYASVSLTPHHPNTESCRTLKSTHLSLTFTLDSATPHAIKINTYNIILTSNPYLWDSFLCIIDSQTQQEVPLPSSPAYLRDTQQTCSVEQLQHLSFPFSGTSPTRYHIMTLRPGETITRTVVFDSSCLMHRYRSVLVEGRSYDIKLKPGVMGGRWIWHDEEDDRGRDTLPLNWGNVEVVEREEVTRFTFEGFGEGGMGYPEPNCHLEH
jgi:hypothetical protein